MVLKLVGSPFSTCTARVATVLHEKKVPYELIHVDLGKGEQKKPDFITHQPFGQVPYIIVSDHHPFLTLTDLGHNRRRTALSSTNLAPFAVTSLLNMPTREPN